ncbi:MAG TPA: SDR family oxidoreductase [Tepidisphaeraceae bacterium]|nr:SDR family oxidoreductase [Tepidisphaeraceae bacterium]
MHLNNRVALVTGGSKRIGRAIVQELADSGFDVLYTTRDQRAADAPASGKGRIVPITLDVTALPQSADALLETVQQSFGRLDVLVHNASIYDDGRLSHTSLRLIRRVNRVHIEVPIVLTKAFAQLLRASKGHVINMIDAGIDRPMPAYLAYSASKAALANLTISMARELAPEVTVNGVAPGVLEWPPGFPEHDKDAYVARTPLARTGTPADAARLVRYLATEGSYITGQIIRVDGGRSII